MNIKVELIKDGWLKEETWAMSTKQAKEEAKRLLSERIVEYILLIDPISNRKLMYAQRRGYRAATN